MDGLHLPPFLHREIFRLGTNVVTPLSLLLLALTVLGAVLAGKLARRLVRTLVLRRHHDQNLGLAYALSRVAQYVVVLAIVLLGLENVGLSLTALAAFGAVLSVGLGFGLQSLLVNIVSGVVLLLERPIQKGDTIRVGDVLGTVEDIAIRATALTTRDGVSVIVPNSAIVTGIVHNHSAPTPALRTTIRVGVAYGSDTEQVAACLLRVAADAPAVLSEPPPIVLFSDFGDSALLFDLCVWVSDPRTVLNEASALRFAIERALRTTGIVIPFPQRDVTVRQPSHPASLPATCSSSSVTGAP